MTQPALHGFSRRQSPGLVRFGHRQRLLAAFAFAGLALIAACGQPGGRQALTIDPAVVALVNSDPIYGSDVQLEAAALGLVQPGEELATDDPRFQEIMEQLIDQRLLAQEAEARALDQDDAARHRLQVARERLLGNILVETVVSESVGEAAIREMYDQQVRLLQLGTEVRARHIQVATEPEAADLIKELQAGTEFAALAFERSLDTTTRLEGGDLGFVLPEQFDPAFARALRDTAAGEVAGPFQSEAGWHVLKVEQRRTEAPPSLEDLRPDIIRFMTLKEITGVIQRLRSKATIDRLVAGASTEDDPLAAGPPPPPRETAPRIGPTAPPSTEQAPANSGQSQTPAEAAPEAEPTPAEPPVTPPN